MKKNIITLLLAAGLTLGACMGAGAAADAPAGEAAPVIEETAQHQAAGALNEKEQQAEEARAFAQSLIFKLAQASEEELDEIFLSMNKRTDDSRNINCTCCGYDSCVQMATAMLPKRVM